MKALGIVAEYDPFHNGHRYHIAQSKKITGADVIVCMLSGDFVQRGTPSFYDKYARTRMALDGGADIVLMLPFAYSCQTAEVFAFGALHLLNLIGCTMLSFGSECNDIELLQQAAYDLCQQDHHSCPAIKTHLSSGRSFAKARQLVLSSRNPQAAALLNHPNNILAIEYLKQILLHNYPITPYAIKRVSVLHDEPIKKNTFSSASHIRQMICDHNKDFTSCVPDFVADMLQTLPYNLLENYRTILYQTLLIHTSQSLCAFPDISLSLANKMKNNLSFFSDIEEYIDLVADKRYTKSRIRRSLCHILIHFQYAHKDLSLIAPSYLRLLGFNETGKKYLATRKKTNLVLSNVKDGYRKVDETQRTFLDYDLRASDIYQLGIGGQKATDYRMTPIYIP